MREPSAKVVVAVLAGAVVIGGVVLYRSMQAPAPPPEQPTPPPAATPEKPPDAPLPGVQASDARLLSLFGAVSPRADVQGFLKSGDLLNRFSVVADNLAEGVTPRKQLGSFAPREPFGTTKAGDKFVISQQSYQRYDAFGDAVASVDAPAFAKAVREVHPLLESAYHHLGYPGAKLDEVLAKAARRILEAPLNPGEVAVEKAGPLWFYADPALEKAGPIEKHLLRMGPRNERIVQDKVREVAVALGLQIGR